MSKQAITEEMGIHKEWYKEAKEQTLDTLLGFLNRLSNDYEHDYGTICHALSAGAVAAASAMDRGPQGGITGAQAGFIMWGFVQNWLEEQGAMRLIKYDKMLYPQYAHDFEKTIALDTWTQLQEKAQQNILERGYSAPEAKRALPGVIDHWLSIVNGNVPFGYWVDEGL